MSLSWRKLYRRSTTAWSMLPLFTRALGTELRRFSDDDDAIDLGGLEPAQAIARMCGATTGDRRMLDRALSELTAAGYIAIERGQLRIDASVSGDEKGGRRRARTVHESDANSTRTEREPNANHTRTEHEPDASQTRTIRESDANHTRTEHEKALNSPESLKSAPVEKRREEKTREEREKTREAARALTIAGPCPDDSGDGIETSLRQGYQRRYHQTVGDAWLTHVSDDQWVKRAASWARSQERPAEAVERFLDGAFGPSVSPSWKRERYPWKWLAENPGRTAARSSKPVGFMGDHASAEAAAEDLVSRIPTVSLEAREGESW
jgi:hypothetical protein